jgi:broad specificity phosphatase PhoE
MTHFLYVVRHGEAAPHDGPLSPAGEQQARLTGERLKGAPLSAIYHGPLPRAAQAASLIAAWFPDVPVSASELAGDYLPSDPDPAGLPPALISFNDAGHLTPELRWTGFPAAARPASG